MIHLDDMAREALETAQKREEKGQLKSDTTSILKHCAGEVVEAMWSLVALRKFRGTNCDDLADKLADVITCALIAAANEHINIEAALLRVQEKNERRAK